jgi:exodeoxyribonuclease-3
MKVLRQYLAKLLEISPRGMCVCGDFNIVLEDKDIYDPKGKERHIMSSPLEKESLRQVLAIGLKDAFRKFNQGLGHFTWWDYRTGAFQRNRGWRIDHHYLTDNLYQQATSCIIDVEPRKANKPSDHTPVIVEISTLNDVTDEQ